MSMKQLLLFGSFPLTDPKRHGNHGLHEGDADIMRDLKLKADKPLPRFLTRGEALEQFHALAQAYRILGTTLLSTEIAMLPEDRVELQQLMVTIKELDGKA